MITLKQVIHTVLIQCSNYTVLRNITIYITEFSCASEEFCTATQQGGYLEPEMMHLHFSASKMCVQLR